MAKTIDGYQFGKMDIEGWRYTKDLILFHDQVSEGWWRKEGHKVWPDDVEKILEKKPRKLIVGTGAYGVMVVTEQAKSLLEENGIELIAEKTSEAWKTYNTHRGEGVVGAFHLTC